jgi:ATP-dependent Clp protease ATP-binding subunit ClpC
MNEEIRALIESLRRGQYEDPTPKIELLSAALVEHAAEVPLLLSLLKAPQIPLRIAAIVACRKRSEPELLAEVVKLAQDPEARVRKQVPGVLEDVDSPPASEALRILVQDGAEEVREGAVKATAGRNAFRKIQEKLLGTDPSWNVRLAAANALGQLKRPDILPALIKALASENDGDVALRCAQLIDEACKRHEQSAQKMLLQESALMAKVERALNRLGAEHFADLLGWIAAQTIVAVNPQDIAGYGTDLTALAEAGTLPRAHCVSSQCETLMNLLRREPWRSLALLGPSGTGKSALVNELVYQLARPENGGWRVLRVSPTDFMSGTRYLGEWETKVKNMVEAVRKPRRVLLYVPNLSDLSAVGTWSRSDSSVATALGPYLEDGSVVVLGESTPEEFERGLGRVPSLQRLFDRVLVSEASEEQTAAILRAVRDEEKLPVGDQVLNQMQDASGQFFNHVSRPGNAVAVLRAVIQIARETAKPVAFRDVLESMSKSTGIPVGLLDDAIPLDQGEVRSFFEQRIIGQPEAVEAVVDLVTLIKAGLTDPQKPFGVMMFIGPTGVGKTELARSLAEYIFGHATRLKRFDMSEFATTDGFVRLIGSPNENGLLTDAVRQHPFSVILLDEIEKSNVNVFDLCLQIFDAGRLTDGRGRTVDFRRTIVILTSNIGATAPGAAFGFKPADGAQAAEVDKDRTFRELTRFFRPEFLNRLDRIVQFRPLSLEVAEHIARREIDLVLQRSGLRRRSLAVEIDPAVVSLLVREGYSPHFGARPLKRTVERLILLPVARSISSGGLRDHTLLHLRSAKGKIEVSVTAPPREKPASKSVTPPVAGENPGQAVAALLDELGALDPRIRPLADRKTELLAQTHTPDFYQNAALRSATFDEIHKLDQFLALRDALGRALRGLHDRLERERPRETEIPALRDRIDQLRAELEQLGFIAACKDARDLGDALIGLSQVDRSGTRIGAVEKLAAMYRSLAERRRLDVEVLGEWHDEKQDRAYLLVSGLGAFALLKRESGLHQMDHRTRAKHTRSGREVVNEDREVVRVEVLPAKGQPDKKFRQAVKATVTGLRPARSRLLEKADFKVALFHEASLRSIELWACGPREAALERILSVLYAQIPGIVSGETTRAMVVRHYDLGIAARVKDVRTGRTTHRVDRVLKGHLDALLLPRES